MPNALGQFMAGHSGNAGGRPKDEHKEAELARSCALEAIETLVALMRSGKSERIRGTAAQALPDRGWDEIIVRYSERLASLAIPVLEALWRHCLVSYCFYSFLIPSLQSLPPHQLIDFS